MVYLTLWLRFLLKILIVIETIWLPNLFITSLSFNSTSVIYFQSIPENFLNIEKM